MRIVSIFPWLFSGLFTLSSLAAENTQNPASASAKKDAPVVKAVAPQKEDAAPAQPEVDDEAAAEKKEADDTIKVARPVTSDPVQVYGWREKVRV